MWLFSIILILISKISEFDLFVRTSDLSEYLNSICLNFAPISEHRSFYQALVCGKGIDFNDSRLFELKKLGIYHALVVSGAHLTFLSTLLNAILIRKKGLLFILLFTYSLLTGAQPPVIRAFFQIIVDTAQEKGKWFWNDFEVSFVSMLICLAINPSWINSYSLLLSSVASLGITMFKKKNLLSQSLFMYALIFIFLLPLSPPHPLSILTNIFVAPFIGAILFPLSICSFFIPYLHSLSDPLWTTLFYVSGLVSDELSTLNSQWIPLRYLWIGLFILQFYGILKDKRFLK